LEKRDEEQLREVARVVSAESIRVLESELEKRQAEERMAEEAEFSKVRVKQAELDKVSRRAYRNRVFKLEQEAEKFEEELQEAARVISAEALGVFFCCDSDDGEPCSDSPLPGGSVNEISSAAKEAAAETEEKEATVFRTAAAILMACNNSFCHYEVENPHMLTGLVDISRGCGDCRRHWANQDSPRTAK
jgi:hypothetical protein